MVEQTKFISYNGVRKPGFGILSSIDEDYGPTDTKDGSRSTKIDGFIRAKQLYRNPDKEEFNNG